MKATTEEKRARWPWRIEPYPPRPHAGFRGPIIVWRWTPQTQLGGLPAEEVKVHDNLAAAIYAIAKTQE